MDEPSKIEELSAHALALNTVIVSLCCNLARVNPELGAAIRGAFEDAANQAEDLSFLLGDNASQQQFFKGVRIIEAMRGAIFSSNVEPKRGF